MSNPFQDILDETHLKPGEKVKDGKEELTIEKPVGKHKYIVRASEPVEELKQDTIKSYASKAMRDTISGKKDRNAGMKKAYSRLAGTDKPLSEEELEEKTLTPAELKKREEIAKAMERDKPGMDKSKKMAIATAVAKRVAEQIDEMVQGKSYSKDHIEKKIKTGDWEAQTDIKPGKHVELRHHSGKRVQVHVKEDVEIEDLGEGIVKDIKRLSTGKDLKTRIGQEISKSQQASMSGDTKTANKHFKRFDKLDKLTKEEVELEEASFPETMKKAVAAHERGDKTKAKYHLGNAKTARYAMKSTEISKHKEHLDKYAELSKLYEAEDLEQIEELSKTTLKSYTSKAQQDQSKVQRSDADPKEKMQHFIKRQEKINNARWKMQNKVAESETEVVESNVPTREIGGRKFVSAEAAIKLARELAQKRKAGSKASMSDLKAAHAHLAKD